MRYLYLLVMSYGNRFIQVFEFSVLYIAYPFLTMQWQVMWLTISLLKCQKSIGIINLSVSVYFLKMVVQVKVIF